MSSSSNLIKARGLITFHNELTVPEGAMSVADNVNIDEQGVITPRRGFNDFLNSLPASEDRVDQLMVYKDKIIRHSDTSLEFQNSTTFQTFNGTYNSLEEGLRLKYREFKGNLYFTTDSGIKKISAKSSSEFSTLANYIKDAGGIKAVDLYASTLPIDSGFIPPESKVSYRILFGTKDINNNLILGSPSSRFVLTNTSADITTPERQTITVTAANTIVGSEYILISSKEIDYVVWFNVSGSNTAPSTAETVGRTFIEVDINGLTASNTATASKIANELSVNLPGFIVTVDTTTVTIESTEGGDIADIAEGTAGVTGVTVATILQGTISEALAANAQITFTLPQGLTTDYFYQVYRSSTVTVTTGLTLNDIDPGDELRLVIEEAITAADLTAGEITVEDNIPSSFRNVGANLYTNPISGEGIVQANERPPVAKDINLFSNALFYANTRTTHRLQINLLSTIGFTSGVSNFIIGSSTGARTYTFIGEKEVSDITCGSYNNTLETNANDSYILINSSSNERKYYVWFDKGTGVDPLISNKQGIRVDLSDLTGGSTNIEVAQKVEAALTEILDFEVSRVNEVVTVTNTNNGSTDDINTPTSVPSTDIGTGWSLLVTTQGQGEDASQNEVLLSDLDSVAQSIDETARSLVRVINKDSLSPVNAFYLSGPNDLPGIILLEARTLQKEAFYLSSSDTAILSKFNPNLVESQSITTVEFETGSIGDLAKINAAGHGLSTGTELYINSPNTTPAIYGKYTITVLDANNFTVPVEITVEDLVGTGAIYYAVDVVSDNLEMPNRLYFSKTNEPEAVPISNYIDIGPKDSPIERILPLRDSLFILKTDGVYVLSGFDSTSFTVSLLDNTAKIVAPDSAISVNNVIFFLASQGVCTLSETGVSIISKEIENLITKVISTSGFRLKTFSVGYENDQSFFMWCPEKAIDSVATQCFRFNYDERTWTRWTISSTCGVVTPSNIMYLGAGDRNYVLKERKNLDRTDFADREFTRSIAANAIIDNTIRLSSVTDVVVGDVIYQEQYVTISYFNRLLRKLDIDSGMDNDYESTLKMTYGDDIISKLQALNTKLVADDSSGTVTAVVISSTLSIAQSQMNTMIAELNDVACDTQFKNYLESEGTTPYETIITEIEKSTNTATVSYAIPLYLGDVTIYKGISTQIEWKPQHFGNPSTLKQVREGTVIFDQNNFYSATVSYSSDLSPSFVDVPFLSKGVSYFGYGLWGDSKLYWGGEGNDSPFRTIIPQNKQRCRYLTVKFKHVNARETWRILGISLVVRQISTRAYR